MNGTYSSSMQPVSLNLTATQILKDLLPIKRQKEMQQVAFQVIDFNV